MSISANSELPPFPDDVPTHPLLIIDYELIKAGDGGEIDRLWKAATELGFWYLKNHGADNLVNEMFDMTEETFALPLSEKMKYEQGDDGRSFGYKAIGANATDETGALDTAEFINIAQDDAISWPVPTHRTYPSTTMARMPGTIVPFIRTAREINVTLMEVLGERLGLPKGTLTKLHDENIVSGSESRSIRNPPPRSSEDLKRAALGAHTDFGSLSFLHNREGGLQVLVPGTDEWQYVKPLPGCAVCNLGDAMVIFSAGILRSNMHRVLPPPGAQAAYPRRSVVFFSRPCAPVVLRTLEDQSEIIKQAAEAASPEQRKLWETGSSAGDWFARRIRNQRIANRTGPETWRASRGTEHRPNAI